MGIWSAVGSVASSLLGGLFGSSSQSSTNKMQLQMMREQNAWNENMWNKQNEYNTPANQMKRFEAAGLNPNLVYGQGSSGNASSAPTSARADLRAFDASALAASVVSNAIDAYARLQQAKKIKADTEQSEWQSRVLANTYQYMPQVWQNQMALNTSRRALADTQGMYWNGRAGYELSTWERRARYDLAQMDARQQYLRDMVAYDASAARERADQLRLANIRYMQETPLYLRGIRERNKQIGAQTLLAEQLHGYRSLTNPYLERSLKASSEITEFLNENKSDRFIMEMFNGWLNAAGQALEQYQNLRGNKMRPRR